MNLRKILMIVGFVVIVVGMGFGLYFAFFKAPAPEIIEKPDQEFIDARLPLAGLAEPTKPGQEPIITEPISGATGGLLSVSDLTFGSANNLTLSSDGSNAQYYDSSSGLFYKIDSTGALTPLSSKQFFQVESTTWSDDSNKAVLEYPDGSNIVYNFSTGEQATLPRHWEDFEFSPNGNQIISKSMATDVDNRWLISSDLDGTNTKIIAELGENADKVQVAWSPNSQVVAFSKTGDPTSEFNTEEILLIGQNRENFKSLKVRGFDFEAQWADEGDRILYSVTDPNLGYRPVLWTTDVDGDNVGTNTKKINLETWVDKCTVLSGYRAYCAVPKQLDEGAGLDRRVAEESDDVFYFVDLKTGATSFVAEPDQDYSISQISVSSDESSIYFTDKATGALHQIKIK